MTVTVSDKDLKKLSRRDLLELLISLGQERDALQEELEKTKAELNDRTITAQKAGSIAEAAMRLNGVFASAQAAANQYVESVRQHYQKVDEECRRREERCAVLEEQTRQNIDYQLQKAALENKKAEDAVRIKCRSMEIDAKRKSEKYWREAAAKIDALCREYNITKEQVFSEDEEITQRKK